MQEFNSALTKHVLAHPTLNFTPPEKSTRFGGHTGDLRFGLPRDPVHALEQMIEEAVMQYRAEVKKNNAHPFLANFPKKWGVTIWAIVMGAQGHQTSHIHPAGWLSGVYYPQVSAAVAKGGNDNAGWIEFGNPPDEYKLSTEAELTLYQPKEGLMLLFPSYTYHRTIPYLTDKTRVSVAFDVFPIPKMEGINRQSLASVLSPVAIPHSS